VPIQYINCSEEVRQLVEKAVKLLNLDLGDYTLYVTSDPRYAEKHLSHVRDWVRPQIPVAARARELGDKALLLYVPEGLELDAILHELGHVYHRVRGFNVLDIYVGPVRIATCTHSNFAYYLMDVIADAYVVKKLPYIYTRALSSRRRTQVEVMLNTGAFMRAIYRDAALLTPVDQAVAKTSLLMYLQFIDHVVGRYYIPAYSRLIEVIDKAASTRDFAELIKLVLDNVFTPQLNNVLKLLGLEARAAVDFNENEQMVIVKLTIQPR